jgi:regulator of sirC expression with transglutaminase-like and TPR domain
VTRGVRAAIREARAVYGEDSIPAAEPFFAMLDSTARALRARVDTPTHPPGQIEVMAEVVYDDWGIAFDPDQDDLLSLLPHTVVARSRGSCLGVSLLLLMLAEQADVPLHGVLLPGHFFVRYDDGRRRRNIEPNRRAYAHPLRYYRHRYDVATDSWYDLDNLSDREVLAVLRYNMGNIYRASGRMRRAIVAYRQCVRVLPGFAEAWGNLAIALDERGEEEAARSAFTQALMARPSLPNLAGNLGAFELRHGNAAAALAAYRQGVALTPDDPLLHYGIGLAHCALGRIDSARAALVRLERHSRVHVRGGAGTGELVRALTKALDGGCGSVR